MLNDAVSWDFDRVSPAVKVVLIWPSELNLTPETAVIVHTNAFDLLGFCGLGLDQVRLFRLFRDALVG